MVYGMSRVTPKPRYSDTAAPSSTPILRHSDTPIRSSTPIPLLLFFCVAIVVFWEVMAHRSQRAFEPFQLTARDFQGFSPVSSGWEIRSVPVSPSETEPKIAAFLLTPLARAPALRPGSRLDSDGIVTDSAPKKERTDADGIVTDSAPKRSSTPTLPHAHTPILVRLAHGYNMPDCMRIKGYKVELVREEGDRSPGISDQSSVITDQWAGNGREDILQKATKVTKPGFAQKLRRGDPAEAVGSEDKEFEQKIAKGTTQGRPESGIRNPASSIQHPASSLQPPASSTLRLQIWRLTNSLGERSIWVTGMLRAGDFGGLDADVRSVPFPKIGVPDDPEWNPQGLTWSSLRHPARNLGWFLRAKWNNARCDWATFLRLRRPAWASGERLTLVSAMQGRAVEAGDEEAAVRQVLAAHRVIHAALREWREKEKITRE